MVRYAWVGLLSLCLLLVGCGASSLNQLQKDGEHWSTEIPVGYQAAYRNLKQRLQECIGLDPNLLSMRKKIRYELYTDIKEGYFTYVTTGIGGDTIWLDIRINGIDENRSNLSITTANKTIMKSWKEQTKAWASGEYHPCP